MTLTKNKTGMDQFQDVRCKLLMHNKTKLWTGYKKRNSKYYDLL